MLSMSRSAVLPEQHYSRDGVIWVHGSPSVEQVVLRCFQEIQRQGIGEWCLITQLSTCKIVKVYPLDAGRVCVQEKTYQEAKDETTRGANKTGKKCALWKNTESGITTDNNYCLVKPLNTIHPKTLENWPEEIGILKELSETINRSVTPYIGQFVYRNGKGKLKQVCVLEYCPESLTTFLQKNCSSFTEQDYLKLCLELAIPVGQLHGVSMVHLDIKSGNFFRTKEDRWVLGDFGASCRLKGSFRTLSPEAQLSRRKHTVSDIRNATTQALDISSLGYTLHEILSSCYQNWPLLFPDPRYQTTSEQTNSRSKFTGAPSDSNSGNRDEKLWALIAKMVNPSSESRPQIKDVIQELQNIVKEASAPAAPVT